MFNFKKDTDNYKTSFDGWKKIESFIPKDKVIWEPFYCDGSSGEYLRSMGFEVIHNDEDFFKNNKGDVIVSNPPFSLILSVLERIKFLDKPFILILPAPMLSYKWFQKLFKNEIQIIIPLKRTVFKKLGSDKSYTPPLGVFYYCWKINLENDITWIE